MMTWRRWKRLTPEAIKYKKFLKKKVQEFREENNWDPEFDITQKVFYIVELNFYVPLTKSWKINEKYIRDIDNPLKPLQDSLESKKNKDGTYIKRVWSNDKNIECIFVEKSYNKYDYTNIKLTLFPYDPKKTNKITSFIKDLYWKDRKSSFKNL